MLSWATIELREKNRKMEEGIYLAGREVEQQRASSSLQNLCY